MVGTAEVASIDYCLNCRSKATLAQKVTAAVTEESAGPSRAVLGDIRQENGGGLGRWMVSARELTLDPEKNGVYSFYVFNNL